MAATQKATDRKAASPRRLPNAIALLKSDHEAVSALFEKYEKGKGRREAGAKAELAKKICDALTVHAQIEEEIFYPACHQEVEDAEELLAEAKVEHQSLKELIGKIEGERPGSEEYDAQVKVLGEYVKHHVKEEQSELFPMVRKSDMDLAEVGAQLEARKKTLMAEMA
jgi:hemerythrin-like domain-containing protein